MPPKKDPAILADVEALYRAYQATGEIQARIAAKFGIAERTVRNYIRDVEKRYAEAIDQPTRLRYKQQMRATCRAALARAIAKGDQKAQDRWAERLCKLDGLYEAERVELSGGVGVGMATADVDITKLRSADRRGRLFDLLKKAGASIASNETNAAAAAAAKDPK